LLGRLHVAVVLLLAVGVFGAVAAEDLSDYEKGLALRLEGKSRQAVEAFDRAIAAEPGHAQALTQKGAALEDQRKWKQAVEAYRQALAVDPSNHFARRNLEQLLAWRLVANPPAGVNPAKEDLIDSGLRALQRGDLGRAQEVFRLAHGLSSDDPRPMFFWALTLEEEGKHREAGVLYRNVVDSFPDYAPARINMVICLLSCGESREAEQETRRAMAAFPETHELRALQSLLQRGSYRGNQRGAGAPVQGSP
jgi:protein O-GlcNAc transferase